MIEFESVAKTFRDGTGAVADLSLSVPSGKVTVLVGPPGCGNTTALRMVNRMVEPTTGQITWDGRPLRSQRRATLRRQMGYLSGRVGLFPHRTVLENIGTVPGLLGWSRAKSRKRSLELLADVGLDRPLADHYPGQLSAGQQLRVGLARALAGDPQVLLMEEPFTAVDPGLRTELHAFFLALQAQLNKTVIVTTHDIDEAMELGDQVAVLRVGGQLAQAGSSQQLLDEPVDTFVGGFVGRDRGYRSLSFQPASSLSLDGVPVVRDVASASADEPTLVVDEDARPVGWLQPGRPGQPAPLGSTFDVAAGTLRNALDAVLTSPVGLAVGVAPGSGRYAGVVAAETILSQVRQVRGQRDEVVLREPEAGRAELVAEDEHAGTAELGEEGGQDVQPEALRPEDGLDADESAAVGHGSRAIKVEVGAHR